MEQYIEQFIALGNTYKLTVIIALVAANFLTGVVASIYMKTFSLKYVGNFLGTKIIPFVLGYYVIVLVAVVQPMWQQWIPWLWGIIVAALSGSILSNVKALGVKLPDSIAKVSD